MISDALQLLKKSNDIELIYSCYNLLGSNFEKLDEYDSSLKYYLLANSILPNLLKNDIDVSKANNYRVTSVINIATIYGKKEQYDSAKRELESIISPELIKNWPNLYAIVIGNLGYIKMKSGNLKGVEALFKQSLKIVCLKFSINCTTVIGFFSIIEIIFSLIFCTTTFDKASFLSWIQTSQ